MKEEGVIKFNCYWIREEPMDDVFVQRLNDWRQRLYSLGLIGATADGIGYGNISQRFKKDQFIISGSGTGNLAKLSSEHYTRVIAYDIERNSVNTAGPVIASSESLTHAAIYATGSEINAAFHVHQHTLWEKLLQTHPSTAIEIPYGTPEMAREVMRLVSKNNHTNSGIFAMAGHEDGIVAFGKDTEEAGRTLLGELVRIGIVTFK